MTSGMKPRLASIGANPVHRQYMFNTGISDSHVRLARQMYALAGIEKQFA